MSDWQSLPSIAEWQNATASARTLNKLDLSLFDRILRRWDAIQEMLRQRAASTSAAPPPINLEDSHGRIQLYALAAFRELIEQWLQELDSDISEEYRTMRAAEVDKIIASTNGGSLLSGIGNNVLQRTQVAQISKRFGFNFTKKAKKTSEPNEEEASGNKSAEIEAIARVHNLVRVINNQLFSILNINPEQQQSAQLRNLLINRLELTIKEHGLGTDAEHSSAYRASPEQIRNRMVIIKDRLLYQKKWYASATDGATSHADPSQLVPLDTEHKYAAKPYNECGDYYYGFAMNANYEIFASNQQKLYSEPSHQIIAFHASYTRGLPVLCAGNIAVRRGKLMIVSADSGHYQPTPDRLLIFLQYLKLKGVDITDTWVSWCNEYPKNKHRIASMPTKLLLTMDEKEEYDRQITPESKRHIADELYKRTKERRLGFSKRVRARLVFEQNAAQTTYEPMNIYTYQCGNTSTVYRNNGNMNYPLGKMPNQQVPGAYYDENQVYYLYNIYDVEVEESGGGADRRWCPASEFIMKSNTNEMFEESKKHADMVPKEILEWSDRGLNNFPPE